MNFREQLHKVRHGPVCNIGGKGGDSTSASTNTTNNVSTTTTQDRRQVTDSGAGAVNADNSNVNLSVSTVDAGSVAMAGGVANNAINQTSAGFQHLADVGASMLNANTALANSINTGGMNEVTSLAADMTSMMQTVLSGAATNQTTAAQLALQPAAQQNPDRYLLLGALAIVGVVAFSMRKGAV